MPLNLCLHILQVQVGAPEEQRGHDRLLHQADPGGAQVPPRPEDCAQGHQGGC